MKKSWEVRRLVEVCKIGDGNHSSNYPKSSEMVDSGIPFIRANNLVDGYVSWSDMKFITPEKHEILKKGHLKAGDVLFTNRGDIGKLAIVGEEFNNSNLNSQIAWFRCLSGLNNRFLFYFLQSPAMRSLYLVEKNGAALQQFTIRQINELKVPYPSIEEQLRVVSILDEAFAAIDQAKENVQRNLQNAKELFQSELNGILANESEGWVKKKLESILEKTGTINPLNTPEKEFIYIDVSSVSKESLEIEEVSSLKGRNAPSRARKLVKTNDIIFATVRPTLRRIAVIHDKYDGQVCSTGYVVLRASDEINYKLIFYYLQTFYFQTKIEGLQKGASYPAVTDREVKQQIISFPLSKLKQEEIVKHLDILSAETKQLKKFYHQKLNYLEELKKSVLQKAFSGELTAIKELEYGLERNF